MFNSADDQPPSPAADPSDLAGLVSKAAAGEADSWAEITDRFTSMVWAIARSHRLGADDSADVVQIVWLRLLENLHRFEHAEALPGWLAATARRAALEMHRDRSSSGDHRPPAVHVVKGLSGQ
jgi:DNA-directed RNA polymerase specialized sigma24 family protein